MHAAVVTAFDQPPVYQEFPDPTAHGENQEIVHVLAAGLHPLVRSLASGSHYTSTDQPPLIPGVDAVVRDRQGHLRYAIMDDAPLGTMAELAAIDTDRSVRLPDDTDPVLVAAAMNPAMSSWVALRRRIAFEPGQSILILGATGNAGRMAVQVARRLGASEVIGAGRRPEALATLHSLGADRTLTLDAAAEAANVDVVIDYLWGDVSTRAMVDMITARRDRNTPLVWIQIGAVAGATAPIPSAALRSSALTIVGSGMGSVPKRAWLEELPRLAEAVAQGEFDVRATPVPLSDVTRVWRDGSADGNRIVFVP